MHAKLKPKEKKNVRMSTNFVEGCMKSDESKKRVDRIWNVVITENGWKNKAKQD